MNDAGQGIGTAEMRRLDVVMPVFNEGGWPRSAVDAVTLAARDGGWDLRMIIVDDGSDDPASIRVLDELASRQAVDLLRQPNSGRFAARAAGLQAVDSQFVLLLDARVLVDPAALGRIREAVERSEGVAWNLDVRSGSPGLGAAFWTGITKVWWRDYYRAGRPVSFGESDFDRYPKGTTAFFAPTEVLRNAAAGFDSHFEDRSLASDDTRLLRAVAKAEAIHVSPEVTCRHHAKAGRGAWFRQSYYRGTTFVDGYLKDPGRADILLAGLLTVGGLGAVAAGVAPRATAAGAALGCLVTGGVTRWSGGTPREALAVGLLTPAFGVTFGAGVVRGLRLAAAARG